MPKLTEHSLLSGSNVAFRAGRSSTRGSAFGADFADQPVPCRLIGVDIVFRCRNSDNRASPRPEIPNPTVGQVYALQIAQCRVVALSYVRGISRTLPRIAAPDARTKLADRPAQ